MSRYLYTIGNDFDFATLDARADADVDTDALICIGMDYKANINWIVAGQTRDRRLNIIKSTCSSIRLSQVSNALCSSSTATTTRARYSTSGQPV